MFDTVLNLRLPSPIEWLILILSGLFVLLIVAALVVAYLP